ncbi:MAG: hypothetical protein ACOYL7_16145, partial [Caldilinea sp.]
WNVCAGGRDEAVDQRPRRCCGGAVWGGGATALAEKICPAAAGSDLSLPELVERGEKVSRQGCFEVL